jgi:hypothetical protein
MFAWICALPVCVSLALAQGQPIVVGFVGGFVRHDNVIHSGVQLARNLRAAYGPDVYIETFENRHRSKAHEKILELLDSNRDGKLSPSEKQNARIILYGHSWGASEAVTLAGELGKEGIPVLLTIQVDSVAKIGERDTVIPPNVAQAINFYQPHGLIHGPSEIRAADATRTRIIGNVRFDYRDNPIKCAEYPWYARTFMKPHIEIECDPRVWDRVESLIRSNLPAMLQKQLRRNAEEPGKFLSLRPADSPLAAQDLRHLFFDSRTAHRSLGLRFRCSIKYASIS